MKYLSIIGFAFLLSQMNVFYSLALAAEPHAGEPPGFKLISSEEDYSHFKNSKNTQGEFIDFIKYIPFSDNEGSFLSLGGLSIIQNLFDKSMRYNI